MAGAIKRGQIRIVHDVYGITNQQIIQHCIPLTTNILINKFHDWISRNNSDQKTVRSEIHREIFNISCTAPGRRSILPRNCCIDNDAITLVANSCAFSPLKQCLCFQSHFSAHLRYRRALNSSHKQADSPPHLRAAALSTLPPALGSARHSRKHTTPSHLNE